MLCPGKRQEGEVSPRWVLRLLRRSDHSPIAPWPARTGQALGADAARGWIEGLGAALDLRLHPLELADPFVPDRHIWALCL